MDNKGIMNLELLFCTTITIILVLIIIPTLDYNLNTNKQIIENTESKQILDKLANNINQINSNKNNFAKKIHLKTTPNNYVIIINSKEIILEINHKKMKSQIDPINLVKNDNNINEIKLYSGNTYLIKKELINNNKTKIINQSSIIITQI